jgi:hypothetical protein
MGSNDFTLHATLPEEIYLLSRLFAERSGLSLEEFVVRAVKRELLVSMDSLTSSEQPL